MLTGMSTAHPATHACVCPCAPVVPVYLNTCASLYKSVGPAPDIPYEPVPNDPFVMASVSSVSSMMLSSSLEWISGLAQGYHPHQCQLPVTDIASKYLFCRQACHPSTMIISSLSVSSTSPLSHNSSTNWPVVAYHLNLICLHLNVTARPYHQKA